MTGPIYEKRSAKPYLEYHLMTWELFLTVREWAQEVADLEGYPVYLVGSVLRMLHPRDIDISIIVPVKEYEEQFGKIPDDRKDWANYIGRAGQILNSKAPYWSALQNRIRWTTQVDVKITPDIWHTEKDKMLLAEPGGKAWVRQWEIGEYGKSEDNKDSSG